MRAGMVALAACLLAFGPASTASAMNANAASAASPSTAASGAPDRGRPVNSQGVDSVESRAADHAAPSVVLHYLGDDDGASDQTGSQQGDQASDGGQTGGDQSEPSPATTSSTAPVTSVTSTPTSQPSTSIPESLDDTSSGYEPATEAPGSIVEPPFDASNRSGPTVTTIPTPDQPAVREFSPSVTGSTVTASGETAATRRAAIMDELFSDGTFFTGDDSLARAAVQPVDSQPKPSVVVLSWLVDRDVKGPSMAMLSPVVVLLTIWDAAASAGSGLAAPASGLGTFVLLVLFEKGHLANGVRLFRRRLEA